MTPAEERELRERLRYEVELAEARKRNLARRQRMKLQGNWKYPKGALAHITRNDSKIKPDAPLALRPHEVAALDMQGSVVIKRQIWPPELYKQGWCQYAQEGQQRPIAEPCAYFGRTPANALYVYSDDPRYRELNEKEWTKIDARCMPSKAVRFWVVVTKAERPKGTTYWMLSLQRIDRSPAL